ncbi:MAG: DUF6177 family protein [Microbacterium sp.]
MEIVNPFADARTDEYTVFESVARRLSYSAPLRNFLGAAHAEGLRPVLVTREDAQLSVPLQAAMRDTGVQWAFRGADGALHNATFGYRLSAFPELWEGPAPDAPTHPLYERIAADGFVGAVTFDVFATHSAAEETRIGPLAEHLLAGFGARPVDRSGREEPLVEWWNHAALTERVRREMPASEDHHVATPDGAWARIAVARTGSGLVERVNGMVPAGAFRDPSATAGAAALASSTALLQTMRGLVDHFHPIAAMVSYGAFRQTEAGLVRQVGPAAPNQPLAMLLGPRAVRDLRVSPKAFRDRHDVTTLGPGRVPSLLVRMSGPDPLWNQLRAFMFDLDAEREAILQGADPGGAR